jgi:hypothetical protein
MASVSWMMCARDTEDTHPQTATNSSVWHDSVYISRLGGDKSLSNGSGETQS